jgi:uncharacterized membrane protein YoaK (UPF0700 family)
MKRVSTGGQAAIVILLCAVAGFVDAFAYLESDVFVANMTGNTVLVGIAIARQQWAPLWFRLGTVAVFFVGAMLGRMLLTVTAGRQWAPLLAEALLVGIACVALPPGGQALALAAAMGVQATAVTRVGAMAINTVVVTSAIARVAERAADHFRPHPAASAATALQWRIQGAAWFGYFGGAALGALAAKWSWALLVPAAALGLMALMLLRAPRIGVEPASA